MQRILKSVRTLTWSGFGFVVLLLCLDAAISFQQARRFLDNDLWVAHSRNGLSELQNVLSQMQAAETGVRGFLITGDGAYLQPYQAAVRDLGPAMLRLEGLLKNDVQQPERIGELRAKCTAKLTALEHIISLSEQQGFDAARRAIGPPRGTQEMDDIHALVVSIQNDQFDLLSVRSRHARRSAIAFLATGPLAMLLSLGIAAVAAYLIRRELAARKQAEQLAEEQSQRFFTTLANIGDGVICADARGRITYVNGAALIVIGWTEPEVMGQELNQIVKIVDEQSRQPLENAAATALREARVVDPSDHSLLLTRGGAELSIDQSASPIRDHQGRLVGAVLVLRDISERRQIERLEHEQNRMLRHDQRRKDEFLAVLAHELRNPLAPICNALQLLRLAPPDSTTAMELRDLMERQVQQLIRLIDDLLDVSRITSGKLELRKARVELGKCVASAIDASRPLMDAANHELIVSLPGQPLYLDADGARITQVVSNLLNNAAKYTVAGGKIWLTIERQGSDVLIGIKDTGVGIPAEMLARVFEMFTQVDSSLTRSQGGLGIGLTLVRTLVEMHGGTVTAASEGVGLGSEFMIRLPLLIEGWRRGPTLPEKRPVAADRLPMRKVLVVDDTRAALYILSQLLRALGQQVRTAQSGLLALEAIASEKPDIIFSDIAMPGMNGYELAEMLRAIPGLETATLVALTGHGQEEDIRRAHKAGFNPHVVKPLSLDVLRSLLVAIPFVETAAAALPVTRERETELLRSGTNP